MGAPVRWASPRLDTWYPAGWLECPKRPGRSPAGGEVTAGGVLHVRNGAQPAAGVEALRLEERWRVGGPDGGTLFGRVIRAAADKDGNVYLLDAQLNHVEVFGPDGRHLRTLSREGEGPGEIRMPADMLFLSDGNSGIVTRIPGRLVKLDLAGNPAGTVTIGAPSPIEGGFRQVHYGGCAGGQLYIAGREDQQDGACSVRTWFIGRIPSVGFRRWARVARGARLRFRARHRCPLHRGRFEAREDVRGVSVSVGDGHRQHLFLRSRNRQGLSASRGHPGTGFPRAIERERCVRLHVRLRGPAGSDLRGVLRREPGTGRGTRMPPHSPPPSVVRRNGPLLASCG
jgi:hypothetical protein